MSLTGRLVAGSVALAALSFSACVESTEHGVTLAPPAYTDPTRIEMLTAAPARAHVVVGEIRLEDGDWRNEQVAETKIRTEAARLQADAVIVYGRGGPLRPRAIRYTGNTPARGTIVASNRTYEQRGGVASGGTGGAGIGSGGAFPDGGIGGRR